MKYRLMSEKTLANLGMKHMNVVSCDMAWPLLGNPVSDGDITGGVINSCGEVTFERGEWSGDVVLEVFWVSVSTSCC